MNADIGRNVTYAMLILLQGAVTLIEEKALNQGSDDPEKQQWRTKVFRYSYWVTPFGSLHEAKVGLSSRVKDLGGDKMGPDLERFIDWIDTLGQDRSAVRLEDCRVINDRVLAPALRACERMSNGNLP